MICDDSDDDYGGWDDGGDDFVHVDDGGNDDRIVNDFVIVMKVATTIRGLLTYDGGNDLQWWLL